MPTKRPKPQLRTTCKRAAAFAGHRRDIEIYCDSILDGKVLVGQYEKAAVQRYRNDLEKAEARGFFLDWDDANRSIDLIQCLKHSTREYGASHFVEEALRAAGRAEECNRLI